MTYKTARYRIFPQQDGNVYRFYCDVSGALVYTSKPLRAETPEEELRLAWESGARAEFNRCEKCGNWISDVMYNADVHHCVVCTPWEDPPNFCPQPVIAADRNIRVSKTAITFFIITRSFLTRAASLN